MSQSNSNEWPSITQTTLAEQVYQVVRKRILHREFPPGTFIREHEISMATGVSRTPVREALNRLASQNFLERVPRRGFRVPERSWEALLEIYPIVASLELLAGSLALPRLTDHDLAELRVLNGRLAQAAERHDSGAAVELNNAFHHLLSSRSGNQHLTELLVQLRAQVSLLDEWYYSLPEHCADSVRDHAAIIGAIESGEATHVLQLLETNYDRGRAALELEMGRATSAGGAPGVIGDREADLPVEPEPLA